MLSSHSVMPQGPRAKGLKNGQSPRNGVECSHPTIQTPSHINFAYNQARMASQQRAGRLA